MIAEGSLNPFFLLSTILMFFIQMNLDAGTLIRLRVLNFHKAFTMISVFLFTLSSIIITAFICAHTLHRGPHLTTFLPVIGKTLLVVP